MALILAVAGVLLLIAGVGLVYLPAGLIVAGLSALAASYVVAFMEARREDPRASR